MARPDETPEERDARYARNREKMQAWLGERRPLVGENEARNSYAEALAEASNRAAVRYPWPDDRYTPHTTGAERRAYVAGYMDHWLTERE